MKKAKNILLIVVASFSFIVSLIYYIKSIYVYTDEWGTDVSSNNDYVVAIIISICLLCYAIYKTCKNTSNSYCLSYTQLTITSVLSFYSLGVFFKAWFKALSKGKEFAFASYKNYLFIGLFVLLIFVYFLLSYIDLKKEQNNNY